MAVIIGKPLSYLKCEEIGPGGDGDSSSSAYAFATNLDSYLAHLGKKIEYGSLIGASKAVCLEAKSIWGLSIALWYVFLSLFLFLSFSLSPSPYVSLFMLPDKSTVEC